MASYTYYFLFSLIGSVVVFLAVFNAKYTLLKGKTIAGEKLTPDVPGYGKIKWLASRQGIAAMFLVELIFVANLVYAIRLLLGLGDQGYATGIFVFGSLAILIAIIGIMNSMRKSKGKL